MVGQTVSSPSGVSAESNGSSSASSTSGLPLSYANYVQSNVAAVAAAAAAAAGRKRARDPNDDLAMVIPLLLLLYRKDTNGGFVNAINELGTDERWSRRVTIQTTIKFISLANRPS